jgi:hypothetical protein
MAKTGLLSAFRKGAAIDPKRPLPPAVVSYDYTMFNLSLPNNRNDLLKDRWPVATANAPVLPASCRSA